MTFLGNMHIDSNCQIIHRLHIMQYRAKYVGYSSLYFFSLSRIINQNVARKQN